MPFVRPTNTILVAGQPISEELVAEGADIKPGLLVKKGTADHQVALCGGGTYEVEGVVDYDPRQKISDAFSDGDPVRILKGPVIVVGQLENGQSVSKGEALVSGGDGTLKPANVQSVSVPAGGTNVTSDAAQPDLTEAGSLPKDGVVVAFAEESVDASGGQEPIMVRLVI